MYITVKDFVTASVCQSSSYTDLTEPLDWASHLGVLPLGYLQRVK